MAGRLARRVSRRALTALSWPAGAVVTVLLGAILFLPRRVPDLARLTGSPGLGRLQAAAAAWADQNFELIESGAPWLERAGRWVSDYCETGLNSSSFRIPREPPSVTCSREITVVYGADGGLDGRLAALAAVLGTAGWGDRDGDTTAPIPDLDRRQPPEWCINWSPAGGFALPGLLETMPPDHRFRLKRWLDMGIGWISRNQPAELVTTTAADRRGDPRTASATYQPVEIGGTAVGRLAEHALARHEHAIAIRITITYYLNANVNASPDRLRKKMLPVW
jgi:hypothetical protein